MKRYLFSWQEEEGGDSPWDEHGRTVFRSRRMTIGTALTAMPPENAIAQYATFGSEEKVHARKLLRILKALDAAVEKAGTRVCVAEDALDKAYKDREHFLKRFAYNHHKDEKNRGREKVGL